MIAKVYSTIPLGYDGRLVEVEGDTNQGLPAFNIVGMANKTVNEARERVRSALTNSGFCFPTKKVTVNLAPAELIKDGSHLDLPIALAVLIVSGQLLQGDVNGRIFVGELSLSGETKPIRGIINIVQAAKQAGYQEIFLPSGNLTQAKLVQGIKLFGVSSLQELFLHLKGQKFIQPTPDISPITPTSDALPTADILDRIYGQALAKRAVVVAIAGHHNILLSGPPGAGKSLLARAACNLLPPPTPQEQIEIAKINSLVNATQPFPITRPFRTPHHTASTSAIIGGGPQAAPGEISLANNGILFLDELPEYSRNVLESLRQPLEDGRVSVTRANRRMIYPARFILFATMNPCPCGYFGDTTHTCTCLPYQIANYAKRLSGPILDRIDLYIDVKPVPSQLFLTDNSCQTEHTTAKAQITKAIRLQKERYNGAQNLYNGTLTSTEIKKFIHLTDEATILLQSAANKFSLSARAYFKTIKVAQTVADLDNVSQVDVPQIAEALSYRHRDSPH